MDQFIEKKGGCPFGKDMYAICIDANCKKPAVLCREGFEGGNQCGYFHGNCSKVLWKDVTDRIGRNPHLCCPDFDFIIGEMDSLFVEILEKVKGEHEQFRFWVKTYGYSLQTMKFIKNISERNYEDFRGQQLCGVVKEILASTRMKTIPEVNEDEILLLKDKIVKEIGEISSLYLKPGQLGLKKEGNTPLNEAVFDRRLDSKIVKDVNQLRQFFDQKVEKFDLIFRASENRFDIKEFHKTCDGRSMTLVLLQTEFGRIIGGFTPVPWSSGRKHWASDKERWSFIFNLSAREKHPLNLVQFSIANNPEKGPIFGCCDICIVDKSNKEKCNAQFPISYNNSKYVRSADSSFSFTGHPKGKFLTKEWEVFQVIFQ